MSQVGIWVAVLFILSGCGGQHVIHRAGLGAITKVEPSLPEPLMEPTYESIKSVLFEKRCLRCHDDSGISSIYDFTTYNAFMSNQKIFELSADGIEIRFIKTMMDGKMPPKGPPVSATQIEVLRQWAALGFPEK